jgi:hypothetical protein
MIAPVVAEYQVPAVAHPRPPHAVHGVSKILPADRDDGPEPADECGHPANIQLAANAGEQQRRRARQLLAEGPHTDPVPVDDARDAGVLPGHVEVLEVAVGPTGRPRGRGCARAQ